MTERYVDIGQIEGAFAWDDEVIDEETGDPVPATYSDGTLMKGLRVDSIHLNSDASADSDAVRKSQMTTAMADYVSKTDFPLAVDRLADGDILYYDENAAEAWVNLPFLTSGQINLNRIPTTLTGKDADTVDGIHGSALLKKDGTVALTGDWDIGNGRAIKAATLKARSSSGIMLAEDSGSYGVFVADTGLIQFMGNGGATAEFSIDGEARFQDKLEADAFQTPDYVKLDDTGIGLYRRDGDVDNNSLWLNKVGYAGGTTRYRDLTIGDGKGNAVLFVDGSSGYLAIGHNAPSYPLHLKLSSTNIAVLQNTGGTTGRFWLANSSGMAAIDAATNDLVFRTSESATERMRLNSTGLTGIGTNSPGGKLEIEVGSTEGKAALVLDQNDEDQPFIVFEGTQATDLSKNITDDTNAGGVLNGPALYVRVKVGSSTYWLPLYEP